MRRSPICLNASMFVRIICDPASSTEEEYEVFFFFFFNESLQIAFPNNVLVSQFRSWSLQSARHSTEERGEQSSLAFKATWTKKRLDENRADFDRVKKGVFLHYIEKF